MSRRSGFTLVEATAVLVVIVMVALIVVPRFTKLEESQQVASFRLDAERIFREARAEALNRRTDLVLTWNDGLNLTAAASDAPEEGEEQEEERGGPTILTVENPFGAAEIEEVRVAGDTVSEDEWAVEFGARGTVDPAGFSYSLNDRVFWIKVDAQGRVTSGEGNLPAEETIDWEAGQLEQRI